MLSAARSSTSETLPPSFLAGAGRVAPRLLWVVQSSGPKCAAFRMRLRRSAVAQPQIRALASRHARARKFKADGGWLRPTRRRAALTEVDHGQHHVHVGTLLVSFTLASAAALAMNDLSRVDSPYQ